MKNAQRRRAFTLVLAPRAWMGLQSGKIGEHEIALTAATARAWYGYSLDDPLAGEMVYPRALWRKISEEVAA